MYNVYKWSLETIIGHMKLLKVVRELKTEGSLSNWGSRVLFVH